MSTRSTIGVSIPAGSSSLICEIAFRTSFTARSTSVSIANSTVVAELPSEIVELTCLTPASPPTAFSMRLVVELSSCVGDAPACVTVTLTIGKFTFGFAFIGKRRNDATPPKLSAIKSTIIGMGWRIAQDEIFTQRSFAPLRRRLPARRLLARPHRPC